MTSQRLIRTIAGRQIFCESSFEIAARNARCVELVDSGLSFTQAGEMMGVSRNTVAGAVHRARNPDYISVEADRRKLKRHQFRIVAEQERIACVKARVESIMATRNIAPKYVPFLELYAKGLTMEDIGHRKNCTRQRVQQILKVYGIMVRNLG